MEGRNKFLLGTVTVGSIAGIWWYYSRQPKIKVLKADAVTKSVQYKMSVNGKTITDTIFMGDAPNQIAFGDSDKHYALAQSQPNFGIITLDLGFIDSTGGFKSNLGRVIEF